MNVNTHNTMPRKMNSSTQTNHNRCVFDTLYGVDKNNKIKEWSIHVEDKGEFSLITLSYGYVGGKKTESVTNVRLGKNKGKKNETTHYQQAILDAQSKWTKKHDTDGYTTNYTELKSKIETNKTSGKSVILPMLAQEYKKYQKKVVFPCYIQPKLDGYRMILNSSSVTTRTGKEYTIFKQTQLYKRLCEANVDICLDGELYVHDPEFTFEQYGVLRKQKNLTEQDITNLNQIQYHVYDIVDPALCYRERLEKLRCLPRIEGLCIVESIECKTREQIDDLHQRFVKDGYEGSIVRNSDGKYTCKYRSFDLLKYKDFDDGEFKIVDYTYEKDTSPNNRELGDNKNLIVWICETRNGSGQRFNVQSKGSKEERRLLYTEASTYIGKSLWVQHFGFTADGVPRFPKTARSGKDAIRMEMY